MKITNNYYNLRSFNKIILQATVSDLKSPPSFLCCMQGVCQSSREFLYLSEYQGYELLVLHSLVLFLFGYRSRHWGSFTNLEDLRSTGQSALVNEEMGASSSADSDDNCSLLLVSSFTMLSVLSLSTEGLLYCTSVFCL